MVFVRKVPGRAGTTKVQIAERRGGRDVVLEHVGTAHDDAELAALMATARRKLFPGQGELPVTGAGGPTDAGRAEGRVGTAVITGKSNALLWQVLRASFDRLGFDAVGDEAFAQLVLARIVEPTSKADSLRVLDDLGIAHASLRTMFRSLQRAQDRDYRGRLAQACFAHAVTAGDVSLCLYDVTTLYFEAENEDPDAGGKTGLRKVGYSNYAEVLVMPRCVLRRRCWCCSAGWAGGARAA